MIVIDRDAKLMAQPGFMITRFASPKTICLYFARDTQFVICLPSLYTFYYVRIPIKVTRQQASSFAPGGF